MNTHTRMHPVLAGVIALCVVLAGLCNASAQVRAVPVMHALTAEPVVGNIAPGLLRQGQEADLVLRGSGLRDGLDIDFGPGIQAQSTSGTELRGALTHVHVNVDANAATGRRQLVIVQGRAREPQRAYLSVQTGLAVPSGPAMHVLTATPQAAVTAVTPDRLVAGHDYLLRVTSKGLPAGTTFDFGPGVQARSAARMINDHSLALKVHVDAGAAAGRRVVGFQLPAVQNAIAAVAGSKGRGPASIEVVAATQQPVRTLSRVAPAILTGVLPARVRAGSQAQLVFTGQNLKPGLHIDYGPGIHMQPLRPLGDRFVALTSIDADATPGRHTPRATQPGGTVQVRTTAALLVIPPPAARAPVARGTVPDLQAPGLRVDSLYPARLAGGLSYVVQAAGSGFTPRMQIDLGRDVTVEGVDVVNDHSARVRVKVASAALAGMRFSRARVDGRQAWSPQPARVLIERGQQRASLPKPKWKAPDWAHVTVRGRIDLERPKWYSGLASQPPPVDPVTHQPLGQGKIVKVGVDVPTLKDDVIFSWSESNPGLADWYEVHFYKGDTLIATRKIEPQPMHGYNVPALPTVLMPDADLIAKLSLDRLANSAQMSRDSQGNVTVSGPVSPHMSSAATAFADGDDMPPGDFSWEVVGYHRYPASGVASRAVRGINPPTVVKAVEHSERWPLNAPLHPTGMTCGQQAYSSLEVTRLDSTAGKTDKNGFSKEQSTSAHTGDRWQLSGALNLGASPWASMPQTMQWPTGQGTKATTWHFDNVFVDWGDGTVMPLALTMPGGHHYSPNASISLDNLLSDERFKHAYSTVGAYTVRVYQLAEDDMQDHQAGGVSLSANPGGSLYATATQLGAGGSPDTGSQHAKGFGHGQAVADRAYMVMCKTVNIEPRTDADASGPLHLIAAKMRGFPETPGDASPPPGVKVAPRPDTSPYQLMPGAGTSSAGKAAPRSMAGTGSLSRNPPQRASALFAGHGPPSFSACDVSLTGGGYLYYYGAGQLHLTWYLDGQRIDRRTISLPPSTPRSDAQLTAKHPIDPLVSASDLLLSTPIPLDDIGKHTLHFDAEVIPDARGLSGLSGLIGRALGSGQRAPDAQLASQLAAGMTRAPAVGVLPPSGVQLGAGGAHVAWLRAPLRQLAVVRADPVQLAFVQARGRTSSGTATVQQGAATLNGLLRAAGARSRLPPRKPPQWVGSNPLAYNVIGVIEKKACIFHFPVAQGGYFQIGGLQDAQAGLTHQGNLWSGRGLLSLPWPNAGSGTVKLSIPVQFHDWQLADDGVTVEHGDLEVSDPMDTDPKIPAVHMHLSRIKGTAGQTLGADLVVKLANPDIRVFGSANGPAPIQAHAVLSPTGDLYVNDLALPDLSVYDSGFTLRGVKAALDFSVSQGASCDGGPGWNGLALTAGTLEAYTFDLKQGQSAATKDWGIDGSGFCGKQHFGTYDSKYKRGSIHWSGIDADAGGGTFHAVYKGVRAHVPWLDVDLGPTDQTLQAGAGVKDGGKIEFDLKGDAPRHDYGAVSMSADGLALGTMTGVGLVAAAQTTHFGFRADGQVFAADVAVPGLYFGMDGRAYFHEGGGSTHVTLSGTKGLLSQGVIDLKGVDVTATTGPGQRLQFNFAGSLKISDALPAAKAPVSYRVDEVGKDTYAGSGPVTGSFVIHKPFPDAHASTDTVIRPTYVGSQSGSVAEAGSSPLLDFVIPPALADTQHMRYCGDVDLGMFGGPPVKGGFALGYLGSDDFWAAHADVKLGPSGTPLVPPFMSLYEVGGGLGYNVSIESFASGNSCAVTAKIDHTPAFDAHLVVGDPSHFAYGLDGHFTVKVSGPQAGALMQYKAWMLKQSRDWDGKGDFWGKFQYMGGSFDGTLNGHYGFLDDKVYIEATHDAIAMHFGHGSWYIHAGTKNNPVKGHVLIVNAGAWVGVGNAGLYAGAKAHLDQGAGSCGSACARITANALVEAKITPQPHISADGHMDVHAKGCAFDICLNAGVGAGTHIAALPPELAFSFHLGGCPPGHLDVGLRILPSPKPSIGGGLCAW